jgi:hypothetical protein
MAHSCNPGYSGGRDQEDLSLKLAWGNSLRDIILKKKSHKKAGGVVQGVDPEFKPQYFKKRQSDVKRVVEPDGTLTLWYLDDGSRTPVDTRLCGCSRSLCKMPWYLYATFACLSIYFNSSLPYLQFLAYCKCNINSCETFLGNYDKKTACAYSEHFPFEAV